MSPVQDQISGLPDCIKSVHWTNILHFFFCNILVKYSFSTVCSRSDNFEVLLVVRGPLFLERVPYTESPLFTAIHFVILIRALYSLWLQVLVLIRSGLDRRGAVSWRGGERLGGKHLLRGC
eukprot:TRINITY_DN6686_c0_g1_i1.p1 TRINITY_DN6686_c0_g1~~TRINITY_DN6686_c0_g1_i1.p1  ORF type:complete len:121 (-),score=5.64 TRINITY_DN6686_c0_g1_i1:353-715(-)